MGVHEAVGLDTGDKLQLVIDQTPCYQHIVNHIDGPIKVMCDLLHQGRMPAELPRVPAERRAARFAGIGRNDPCPAAATRTSRSATPPPRRWPVTETL